MHIYCIQLITPVRKILHWLPIEHRSILKFLHCGYPKYFAPFLKPRQSVYNTPKAKLMVCSLRSPTLPRQYISLLSILASVLLMMRQRFGMICLMMYVWPLLSTHSEGSSNPISLHKRIHPNFCFPWFLSMALTLAMSQVYDYCFLLCLAYLESVFRWRLGTIKILLELEYNKPDQTNTANYYNIP